MIDRGFIKWQPFNALLSYQEVLKEIAKDELDEKPSFFPEKEEILSDKLQEAYYAKNTIVLTFYEQNRKHEIVTQIKKIEPESNIIYLSNHQAITFKQIINIKNI